MPEFTIETARRVPFYRHRTYRADTIAEACRQAIEDENWHGERMDRNGAKEPFVPPSGKLRTSSASAHLFRSPLNSLRQSTVRRDISRSCSAS